MLKKAETEVVCIAQFMAKQGKEQELLQVMHALLEPTHKEKGCLRYELNQKNEDPRVIVFVEKFVSQEAFDSHCNTPYVRNFLDHVVPLLTESVEVTMCKEILP